MSDNNYDVDRLLGKETEVPIGGVSVKFYPVSVANFNQFVKHAIILGFPKLSQVFNLLFRDINGEESFDRLIEMTTKRSSEELKTIMLAADWPRIRKTIAAQNDLEVPDFDSKKEMAGVEENLDL